VNRTKTLIGIAILSILVPTAPYAIAAPEQQTPAPELLQYVRSAKSSGVNEAEIREKAIAAGWRAADVEQVLASLNVGSPVSAAASRTTSPGSNPATTSGPSVAAKTADRGVPDDYLIGAGDVLSVSVWKEPDASVASVVVRPDGKIAIPLIKEIDVAGQTPQQVENNITTRLEKFINAADVTVIVTGIHSKKIYVLGGVKKEGPIPYTYKMSVMQAIGEAGGLTDYAKRKKIYVLRSQGGKELRLPFNYQEVIKGQKMAQDVALLPGDTLVVPQ
jgi:polysaccharide biosynthesis/export protein